MADLGRLLKVQVDQLASVSLEEGVPGPDDLLEHQDDTLDWVHAQQGLFLVDHEPCGQPTEVISYLLLQKGFR